MRALCLALALLAVPVAPEPSRAEPSRIETPMLAARVADGALPAVAERLPTEPLVVDLAAKDRQAGRHGGTLRMFIKRTKDVRYLGAYGYARLVGYDEDYRLTPDLLRAVETSPDGRAVTLHLRQGHRWSDGHPFTAEDLRYWWEDVALNETLSPKGPPVEMMVKGALPRFEVLSETAVRYTWSAPNPRFLPALARARPVYISRPAHYMKQFHAEYAEPEALAAAVETANAKRWAKLHNRRDNLYRFDNPDLPVLQPWLNTSKKN
ncbi:MAG: ABC transporter substrate-binding protein, partial [Pseudomonadota bacterium]